MNSNNHVVALIAKIKRDVYRLNLVPLEASISLPVPIKSHGKIFLAFFFFTGARLKSADLIQIYPPHSKVIVDYPKGKIIHYVNMMALGESDLMNWEKAIGLFPHKEIESFTLQDYRNKRQKLLSQYEIVIDQIAKRAQHIKFKHEFRELFYEICEPCILPFMKNIGKSFFKWLEE